ncbi:MAG: hypothetical protein LUE61_10095 [Clostridiales bacterium]|nr:hypothetical protein [Clostridiales bacterium]
MDVKRGRSRPTGGKTKRRPWYAREILRLLAALAIALAAGLCGWLLPGVAAHWKDVCGTLILSQTDFEQAFSDLGQVLTEGDLTDALEDWCAAVFAPQAAEDASAADPEAAGDNAGAAESASPEPEGSGNGPTSEA